MVSVSLPERKLKPKELFHRLRLGIALRIQFGGLPILSWATSKMPGRRIAAQENHSVLLMVGAIGFEPMTSTV